MASTCFLSLILCFFILFHGGCLAYQSQQQKHQLRAKSECRIERLSALEPTSQLESEAGTVEFWDQNNEQFQCAGVAAVRTAIQPKGLLLPYYTNAPQLIYIVQGQGILGITIPGCPETFESESKLSIGDRRRRFTDRHQKIRRFRQGDVIAMPAGAAHWAYNDREEQMVSVSLLDTGNNDNELDRNFRRFFLAGKARSQQQHQQHGQEQRGQEQDSTNIFDGFDEDILAEVFNVETETVRKLKGEDDQRSRIVRVKKELEVMIPQWEQEEEQETGRPMNGFEETLCSMKLRENIAHPRRADVYNPRGGRVSSLNSQKLPILNLIQLSAERGVLYGNAIMAPHWNLNAHSLIYIIRGSGRLQIVGNTGKSVFNNRVQQGQLIIVPQNFVIVKKAENEGLEWISFKTNDNAMTSPLAGRLSTIRAMPEEVLMNSYGISREDARRLKYNREELTVFGSSRSPREYV